MEAPVHETWQTRPGVRLRREATTVLDDRLKKKTGITNMNPDNLVGKALNPDPLKAAIEVSAEAVVRQHVQGVAQHRLGTDYIDLYQAHSMDSLTPLFDLAKPAVCPDRDRQLRCLDRSVL